MDKNSNGNTIRDIFTDIFVLPFQQTT